MNLLRILLAILVPPLGVFLTFGLGPTFIINLLLTLLGWLQAASMLFGQS
ncbi:MAG: YqaE/Pmp3 family membrane protein [Leptolyngbya sp. IPPAS B-1204]